MEYERIQKVQAGIISPSKLRMALIGPHHQRKKDKSNSNSSRTSPSKLQDSEFVKNSLLAPQDGGFDEEAPGLDVSSMNLSATSVPYSSQGDQPKESLTREYGNAGRVKMPQFSKVEGSNSSMVHPVRTLDEENLDYDSNASSSSFEFHKGDRSLHNPMGRSFQRQMPSKWNDAEKWIMSRQNSQSNYSKKNVPQSQANRLPVINLGRVAPEYVANDHKLLINKIAETKRVDFCQPMSQLGSEKFSFAPAGSLSNGVNASTETCTETKDLQEVGHQELSSTTENSTGIPTIRSVSMRDMGTEMTPIASQEPSRTATPVGATTPLRSPSSSVPSTPRRVAPASTPVEHTTDHESRPTENSSKQLSEQDLKLKTRREIVALGVQLGKMNIAAWASKEEKEKINSPAKTIDTDELDRIEFERRAAAWEEAEKSKHTARFRREEIKIQAWESQHKAKLEAEMRRIEAQVEQMRAQAQAKMVKKISMARQRSEEKRAAAEASKKEQAERTAAQAEYIRQTGHIPSSPFICCGWLR